MQQLAARFGMQCRRSRIWHCCRLPQCPDEQQRDPNNLRESCHELNATVKISVQPLLATVIREHATSWTFALPTRQLPLQSMGPLGGSSASAAGWAWAI